MMSPDLLRDVAITPVKTYKLRPSIDVPVRQPNHERVDMTKMLVEVADLS